jgi:PAS domain S-box-containing protein
MADHGDVGVSSADSGPVGAKQNNLTDGAAHADLLFRAVQDYAIYTLDIDGSITSWNLGAKRINGYTAQEIIGKHFSTLYPTEDVVGGKTDRQLEEVAVTGRSEDEFWHVRKDGTRFWANAVITAILDHDGVLIGFGNITRDMSERKQFIDELQEARDAAEQANRAKDEFLSHMSHELRTPLNAVIGFSQVLEMSALDGSQVEAVTHISQAGHHLLGLINEIMDIAVVAAGEFSINLEPVDIAATVDDTIGLLRPLAMDKGVRVTAESTIRLEAIADPKRLQQVLLNLVSNAVKYNRPGGGVRVSWAPDNLGRARVVVADTGPGIAADLLERLFVPFDRLGAEAAGIEGTGLGLPLSKSLVETMGGTIDVTSEPGLGTTFTVDLPTAPATNETPLALPTPNAPIAHVLYIEDNLVNLQLVRHVLATRPGIELIPAMRGQAGLDLARTTTLDLILLDLNLPDMTGEDVLHQLQNNPTTTDLPVVVMSADAEPGRIALLQALGAVDYLTKPIDVHELLAIVDHVLGMRGSRHDRMHIAKPHALGVKPGYR